MTKAYSKAAKRAKKKAGGKRAMFQKLGDIQQAIEEPDDDAPRVTVIAARARLMGCEPTPKMLDPMLCFEAGRAIDLGAGRDAKKLWTVFAALDHAEHTYYHRIIGRPRFPNVAKMEYLPETLEVRPDDRPDHRTPDEKDRAAANAWMHWQGLLGCLRGHERTTIIRALWQMDELHKGADLTVTGQSFVAAMRMLAEVRERSK